MKVIWLGSVFLNSMISSRFKKIISISCYTPIKQVKIPETPIGGILAVLHTAIQMEIFLFKEKIFLFY